MELGLGEWGRFGFDLGLIANSLTVDSMYKAWSDLLTSLGCRKAVDTGNWRVEAGAWHDDSGHRVVFVVNHDAENAQDTQLPDGRKLSLAPGESRAVVLER